ncbi:MAG: MmcQ/YjbR family DNA-binding protein [Bacteroidota bacterium]|nr:MmcQ/YjbR family DNA-binding protein [Bacteroidota bacterium]MDP4214703.1 MmcQ/YjbR family DNA-binding protein [Bacteroidota bacterium]MDP4244326.1 MmcQ/YjbR family DNA-binding protein [Bacteroidota bacterium]MDP4256080.1 MmcQ/YjbR family DNA-binding protein [Bacteroidota bacterium]MDP4258521.1 MmcQ/YjbR family DNA-binding protein [Bacteroidota bacterium]
MNIETLRAYCLEKAGAEEGFPFGETALVFKVGGKMFLLAMLDSPVLEFNVKCDPEQAIEWRERFAAVRPGYHMNKRLWNTVTVDGTIPGNVIRQMIDDSYGLVVASLPKKDREALARRRPRKR